MSGGEGLTALAEMRILDDLLVRVKELESALAAVPEPAPRCDACAGRWPIEVECAKCSGAIDRALSAVPEPPSPVTVALLKALKRILLEVDFMVERGQIPDVRQDIIYQMAHEAIALAESAPVSPVPEKLAGTPETPTAEGMALIAAERLRQVRREGYSESHDDAHDLGELSQAGAAYAEVASAMARVASADEFDAYMMRSEGKWPFEEASWKPVDDPIRNLVKAGALIAAEIDRLRRAASSVTGETASPSKKATQDQG